MIQQRQAEITEVHGEVFGERVVIPQTVYEPLDDDELIRKAAEAENGDKFKRLFSGDISGYPSHSEADLAFCLIVAFWTAGDRNQTLRLFKRSDLYRDKGDEKRSSDGRTYAEVTADKAIAATTDFYTPSANGQEPGANTQKSGKRKVVKTADLHAGLEKLGYKFRMNLLDDSIEVNQERMTDGHRALIDNQMRDKGFSSSLRIENAYHAQAFKNPYHPIKEYYEGLEWDGKHHIAALAAHIETDDDVWALAALTRFFVGSVAKIMKQAQHPMLVLVGNQGVGKSRLARWLFPLEQYFCEGPIRPDDKDSYIRLCRMWGWEVSELQATTRKADREALKDFITKREVTVRKPYGRFDMTKPALASLIGTINESGTGFLNDPTGSRRFLILKLNGIDWRYSQTVDPNDIWSQAVHLYKTGEPWELNPEESAQQHLINTDYELTTPLEEFFHKH
ncbi:MAG: VapE domain-containing protein, partial [Candidatus Promineifilaceae bacterium]